MPNETAKISTTKNAKEASNQPEENKFDATIKGPKEWLNHQLPYDVGGIMVVDIIISLLILAFFLFLRTVFARVFVGFLKIWMDRFNWKMGKKLITNMLPPFKFFFVILGLYFSEKYLMANPEFSDFFNKITTTLFTFTFFWALYSFITPASQAIGKFGRVSKLLEKSAVFDIRRLSANVIKILVVFFGAVNLLEKWDINVIGFIATLSVGGVAIAFAAQQTVSNIFASLMMYINESFKVGDRIQTKDVHGFVEYMGFLSTKIRTLDKTLITVPNSNLANNPITNWSEITHRRVYETIGLEYGTTQSQIHAISKKIHKLITSHPDIDHDLMRLVNFSALSDSSVDILMVFYTKVTGFEDFMRIKEGIMLEIKKIVESEKASFAFPSQTIYLEKVADHTVR